MNLRSRWITRRRVVLATIGLAASGLMGYLTLDGIEFDKLEGAISSASWQWFSLTLLTRGAAFLFLTWRSKRFLAPVAPLSTGRILRSQFVAFTGNNILPFRLGELLRLEYLSRHAGAPRASILAVLAAERLLDTWMLLIILAFATLLMGTELVVVSSLYFGVGLIVAGTLGALLIGQRPDVVGHIVSLVLRPFPRQVRGFVSSKYDSFADGLSSFGSLRELLGVLLATMGYWACSLCTITIWAHAFSLDLPWWSPALVLSFIAFGTALPSAPGFVGTYHYFCSVAFETLGVAALLATSIAIVGHFMSTVPYTLVGIAVILLDALRGDLFGPPQPPSYEPD